MSTFSSLRRTFDAALWNEDGETILAILDKLYYAEEWDVYEEWRKEAETVLSNLDEPRSSNEEILQFI